jgi:hypothetical protein
MTAITDALNRRCGPYFGHRPLQLRCTYCMPKEVFGRDYVFRPVRGPHIRRDHTAGAFSWRMGSRDPPHRRRADGARDLDAGKHDFSRAGLRDLTMTTSARS